MSKGYYSIPGYFENCEIKNDEVRTPGFLGKTLFKYSNHTLKEPGFFGKTILEFKNGAIYKYGFFGEKLFVVTKTGEVKEKGLFGKSVGAIPLHWMKGFEEETKNEPYYENRENAEIDDNYSEQHNVLGEQTTVHNEDGSTTYSYLNGGISVTVGPVEERISLMQPYNEVFAYAIFFNKYPVCKDPNIMKEEEYAHWQFMSCGVSEINKLHKELFNKGFYKEASVKEKLSIYKVGEIRNVANTLGISVSGKKNNIIEQISIKATIEQVNSVLRDPVYSLSEKAIKYQEKHKKEIECFYSNNY